MQYYAMMCHRYPESIRPEIADLLKQALSLHKKSATKAKWLSIFVPGLGQAYAKEYGNAVNALLLNGFDIFITLYTIGLGHYSDALEKIGDLQDGEMQAVSRNLHLWRGVAYYASGDPASAQREFIDVREHTVIDAEEIEGEWDPALLRALTADRDILSTMISMSYIPSADAYAREIISADTDTRRLQALCYLSLIHASLGQHGAYTENLVGALLT